MPTLEIVADGPCIEGCEIIEEFCVLSDQVLLLKDQRGFFLSIDCFDSLGPFKCEKSAFLGLAEFYSLRSDRLMEKMNSIEKIIYQD